MKIINVLDLNPAEVLEKLIHLPVEKLTQALKTINLHYNDTSYIDDATAGKDLHTEKTEN